MGASSSLAPPDEGVSVWNAKSQRRAFIKPKYSPFRKRKPLKTTISLDLRARARANPCNNSRPQAVVQRKASCLDLRLRLYRTARTIWNISWDGRATTKSAHLPTSPLRDNKSSLGADDGQACVTQRTGHGLPPTAHSTLHRAVWFPFSILGVTAFLPLTTAIPNNFFETQLIKLCLAKMVFRVVPQERAH